jgi:hypothetical protein
MSNEDRGAFPVCANVHPAVHHHHRVRVDLRIAEGTCWYDGEPGRTVRMRVRIAKAVG